MRRAARHCPKAALLASLAGCGWSLLAPAQQPGADAGRTFIACPVYRDTNSGRKSGCWLAVDPADGVRYDISLGRTKPQIGHEVLVEGRLGSANHSSVPDSPCGGAVLRPVVVSVLEATCPRFMLPAEGYAGRRFILDPKVVLPPADTSEPPPPPPYGPRTWTIQFTFGSDFLQYQYSEIILDAIGRYIRASRPHRIEVTGYAVTAPRSVSGIRLAEPPQLARSRARMVELALRRLGAPVRLLHVRWADNPPPLTDVPGMAEPSRRRVEVRLTY